MQENDDILGSSRIRFQFKIYKSTGKEFEDLFTRIMNYYDPDFMQVRPQGKFGDGGCDGRNAKTKTYYQAYGPEQLDNNKAIKKYKEDYEKIKKNYKDIKKYYFVVNDKYKGVTNNLTNSFEKFINKESIEGEILTVKNLEAMLFSLEKAEIRSVLGDTPKAEELAGLDYNALNEVIGYLRALKIDLTIAGKLNVPDWDRKIQLNEISGINKQRLEVGSMYLGDLEKYLNESPTLSNLLAKDVARLYKEIKKENPKNRNDDILSKLLQRMLPNTQLMYITAVCTICAKYFESCDILESPKPEDH